MKKDTEELILSEIIKLNTEVLKTNSKLGYIEQDIKRMYERFDGIDARLDRMDERFDKTDERLAVIEEKLDWTIEYSGKQLLDHEKRIATFEAA